MAGSSSPSRHVDVLILGAGTAGLGARRAVKRAGASALLVDPGPFGTTCARVGCMPSKLLIAAADAAHHAREAPVFGVHPREVRIDGPAVLRRVQSERDRFVGFVTEVTDEARDEGELLVGRGRILGRNEASVDLSDGGTAAIGFDRLVVATGSRTFIPAPFRDLEPRVMLTTDQIFELDDLPESLLVVGTGVIGLELGQAFHRLGVRTTLLGKGGKVAQLTDPVVTASARAILERELDLHVAPTFHGVEGAEDGGVAIHFTDRDGHERRARFARVLVAAGRRPNLDGLGLETAGVDLTADTIDPDTMQLGEHPFFVAGDANDLHPLLHEAVDDGRVAGENAARYPEIRALRRRTPLAVVFSDPQVATVGQRFAELDDCAAMAGEIDYGNQGRARCQAINAGKVRIYAEPHSGRLLGAEMFGPRVEHTAHLLAWSIQMGLCAEQVLEMPFYHPVVEEGIRTALRDLSGNLRHGTRIKCPVEEVGVGS
ncbi:MAG: dihydrolipoyl dehydrogenase [Myxococcota bacterium]